MPLIHFHHLHSFTFSSQTGIPWIVRTGWAGLLGDVSQIIKCVPTFVWKRFHRLADVLHFWFQIHHIPLEYEAQDPKTQNKIQVLFFPSVMSRLSTILKVCNMPGIHMITLNELESLPSFPSAINTDTIIDEDTIEWIFDMFVDNPAYFFGHYFDPVSQLNMAHYRSHSLAMRTNMRRCFNNEYLDADVCLQDFYRIQGFPIWPIAYATALELSKHFRTRMVHFADDVKYVEPERKESLKRKDSCDMSTEMGVSRAIKFKQLRRAVSQANEMRSIKRKRRVTDVKRVKRVRTMEQ